MKLTQQDKNRLLILVGLAITVYMVNSWIKSSPGRGLNLELLITILSSGIGIILAISVHESAHAYMAYLRGDITAKLMGRVTLNPFKHLDPVGTLMFIVTRFGWARPVMVNPWNLKNPKRDMALVAAAGPAANFILAFVSGIFFQLLLSSYGWFGGLIGELAISVLLVVLKTICAYNIGLGLFNLIPIPPLDGSKIFDYLAETNISNTHAMTGPFLLILLFITGLHQIFLIAPFNFLFRFFLGWFS